MKKLVSLLLAAALVFTTVGGLCLLAYAEETDIVVGDFSKGGLDGWKLQGGSAPVAVSADVKRAGKISSLQWSGFSADVTSNYIWSPEFNTEGKQLGDIVAKNYVNLWVYSETANGQKFKILIYDQKSGAGYQGTTFTADWSGWKLISWDISNITLKSFNKSNVEAAAEDSIRFALNVGQDKATVMPSTVLYFDSIWCSDENPANISQTEEVTFSIADGETGVSKMQKQYAFTANKPFAYGSDSLNAFAEVKVNDAALSVNTDYTVSQEHNVLYLTLKNNLPDHASVSFTLKEGAPFADGTALESAFTSSFTAKSDLYVIGDFSRENGFAGWGYAENVAAGDAPYESDEVTMSGKDFALKWGNHKKDGNPYNNRVRRDGLSGIGFFTYDQLGAWIYSDKANGQRMNILIGNATLNKSKNKQITIDWTGWKLVSLDLKKDIKLSDYGDDAKDTDSWYFWYQTSGYGAEALDNTLLYVDSIFLYNREYYADKTAFLGDFGKNSTDGWNRNINGIGECALTAEKTREGSITSMKWIPYTGYTESKKTSELVSSNAAGLTLGDVLEKSYISFWVYLDGTQDQLFNIYFYDSTTGGVAVARQQRIQGGVNDWQLISIDISGWTLSTFDKISNGAVMKAAASTDAIRPQFNIGGQGTAVIEGNTLYLDSIWVSDENSVVSSEMTSTIDSGAEISSVIKAIGFTDFAADFIVGNDYSDKVSVTLDGAEVAKSEYRVQQEGNNLYVVFTNGLMPGASYQVTVLPINMANKSYAAKTVSFTTTAAHYDVSYSFGADGSMTTLPENGSVQANAKLINATAEDTEARIIVAVYDGSRNLVRAGMGDLVTVKKGKSVTLKKSITADSYAGYTVKSYVWQWDSLVPYSAEMGQIQ